MEKALSKKIDKTNGVTRRWYEKIIVITIYCDLFEWRAPISDDGVHRRLYFIDMKGGI